MKPQLWQDDNKRTECVNLPLMTVGVSEPPQLVYLKTYTHFIAIVPTCAHLQTCSMLESMLWSRLLRIDFYFWHGLCDCNSIVSPWRCCLSYLLSLLSTCLVFVTWCAFTYSSEWRIKKLPHMCVTTWLCVCVWLFVVCVLRVCVCVACVCKLVDRP